MFKRLLIASLMGSLALSLCGCPPTGNSNGNSSSQNENSTGESNENTGSTANENTNGGPAANENSGQTGNQNDNGTSANQNANTAANSNENDNATANANENGGGTAAIIGRFAGTLTGTSTQSLNGSQTGSFARSYATSLQFESALAPLVIPIPNYSATTVQNLTSVQTGQTQTFNFSDSIGPIVVVATVREATYQSSQAHVIVDLTYTGTSATLNRSGTGVHTFDAVINASGNLGVTSNTSYAVRQSTASINFDTTDVIAVTGDLAKQP